MSSHFESFSSSTPFISQGIITGGTFNHKVDNRVDIRGSKTGFDRLQDAIAPGAFHNSMDRFDPPKCHPNTRIAVIKNIMDWILGQDPKTKSALIMWLKGAAGAGKSAIAQSIAERCFEEGYLLASFFFSRSDSNRNNAQRLFATIAYQMALTLPQVREKLFSVIEHDPMIFTRSLSAQFLSLIVEPIQDLARTGFFQENSICPCLIIIDGLDECLDRQAQVQILHTILQGVNLHHLPLIFLIASRPEHDITNRFNQSDTKKILTRIYLDDSYRPDLDIDLFIRDKFRSITETHPFKQSIPEGWPTDDTIEKLVEKSSGQFIYASTVVKYVESSRHLPHHRLEVIENLQPAQGDRPFAELDALYTYIFSRVDHIELVLRIIAFDILKKIFLDTMGIERILSLAPQEIQVLFCDLASIISVEARPKSTTHKAYISFTILHASLPDFLLDQSRSHQFYIDLEFERLEISRKCAQFLAFQPYTNGHAHWKAIEFLHEHGKDTLHSIDLQNDLYSISIPQWYKTITRATEIQTGSEGTKLLYQYHLRSLHEFFTQQLQAYLSDLRLTLLVTLVDWFMHGDSQNIDTFRPECLLFEVDIALLQVDSKGLGLLLAWDTDQSNECSLLSIFHRYLTIPEISESQYSLNGARFADAAGYCLTYLWDTCPDPITKVHQHCTEYRELIEGQGALAENPLSPHSWREKYSLALDYFRYFLQRAGRSDLLIEQCNHATFNRLSNHFRRKCKKVRKAISRYLERMNVAEHL